jgi:hypothetical protein
METRTRRSPTRSKASRSNQTASHSVLPQKSRAGVRAVAQVQAAGTTGSG